MPFHSFIVCGIEYFLISNNYCCFTNAALCPLALSFSDNHPVTWVQQHLDI